MDRVQIENLYKVNELKDFKLKDTSDLLKVHGIDFKAVEGYNRLDDINRHLYEKFIVNIFNAFGLESRATLVPKGIYFVEDIAYLAKEEPGDEHYTVVGGIVYALDRNGMKSVHRQWVGEGYENLEMIESEGEKYLRFEYEHHERAEWLHVKSENQWY